MLIERLQGKISAIGWTKAKPWCLLAPGRLGKPLLSANGMLYAFEFKWNPNKSGSFPKSFSELYPNSQIAFVDRDNFEQFVG